MLHLAIAALLAIDPAKSTATFSVQHIFVEHVTGTVPIVSGTIDLPDASLVPTSVTAVLDPKKFHTDEPDRDAAMQTPDWFDTPKFPTWTFTSTKITPTANGFTMDGLLTMHSMTQPGALDRGCKRRSGASDLPRDVYGRSSRVRDGDDAPGSGDRWQRRYHARYSGEVT